MAVSRVTGCLCAQDCWTALISAAKEGHIEVVRELLENNVNLEHRDMVGTERVTGRSLCILKFVIIKNTP